MEKRQLIFDLGKREVVAGAYINEKQESILRLDPDSEWEAWLEEFISDHLATGRCVGVASAAETEQAEKLKKVAAKLGLDLQFVDHPPIPMAVSQLFPEREAIVISVDDPVLFTLVGEKGVKTHEAPLSIESITKTLEKLRGELGDPVLIATGHAMSELAADPASAHLRDNLQRIVDAIEPELSLIGILNALDHGETHV